MPVFRLKAYTKFNTTHSWIVDSFFRAREHAKRVGTEGLIYKEEDGITVFLPVHQIVKVKMEKISDE